MKDKDYGSDRKLEDIHRDVDFSNRYRLEYIKHLMSISAGIFVISITFTGSIIKNYSTALNKEFLLFAWTFLIISIIGGIFHMKCWDRFFISYREEFDIGKRRRKRINVFRIISEIFQITFFILGIIFIFIFSFTNIII